MSDVPHPRSGFARLLRPPAARTSRGRRCLAAVVGTVALVSWWGAAASSSQVKLTAWVEGIVLVEATGRPVGRATVSLPEFGLAVNTSPDGRFRFPDPLPAAAPYLLIRAQVVASGFGRWTIRNVPLVPGDTLRLRAELGPRPRTHVIRGAERRPLGRDAVRHTGTCTAWGSHLVPPQTIRVLRTATGVVEEPDFLFYVQHVLPREWIPSWTPDALAAGAIAVKTYGWYHAMSEHAYSSGEGCADVLDDARDQVYDPTYSYATTDEAALVSFGSILQREGHIFQSQYWAGTNGDPCEAVTEGSYAGRMSQWGTQTCGTQGVEWPDIATTFYTGTGWQYLRSITLNPSLESSKTYPWVPQGAAVMTRIKGGSYDGKYYLQLSAPKTATLYQYRPYAGDALTEYHLETALRCGVENSTSCTITLKVIVKDDTGAKVTSTQKVVQANDGVWRVASFDPPASGMDHSFVQVNFVSNQVIGIDGAILTATAA